ncbi:MAG: ArsR/SmtB family transcription factor [Pelagimonas sp.]|uniref:ArsR/SmtB family transcription factor n=1 Tax=Pelagimonas sp. TaxID=2073170 RepID=UPI003D6C1EB0
MKEGPDIARIAALIGDPARANMLTALMSGKALTATELAQEAGITTQTASTHLAKLADGGLVQTRKQGRHKYSTLASDDIAQLLESLMGLAAKTGHLRTRTGPKDAALRKARVCYNHLAGDMGTRLYDSLMQNGQLILQEDDPVLTDHGRAFFTEFGIDLNALEAKRTPLCRACLDWSERRSHLAGGLGRALLSQFIAQGWAKRLPDSRVIRFSSPGAAAFANRFPL